MAGKLPMQILQKLGTQNVNLTPAMEKAIIEAYNQHAINNPPQPSKPSEPIKTRDIKKTEFENKKSSLESQLKSFQNNNRSNAQVEYNNKKAKLTNQNYRTGYTMGERPANNIKALRTWKNKAIASTSKKLNGIHSQITELGKKTNAQIDEEHEAEVQAKSDPQNQRYTRY